MRWDSHAAAAMRRLQLLQPKLCRSRLCVGGVALCGRRGQVDSAGADRCSARG